MEPHHPIPRSLKAGLLLALALLPLVPSYSVAKALSLPRFELAEGLARTQVEILREKYRAVDVATGEFGLFDQERASIHMLKRLNDEENRPHYTFFQFVDKTANGQPGKLQFVDGGHHGISAKAIVDGTQITITPEDKSTGSWDEKDKEHISDQINGNVAWNTLISLASSQKFTLQQAVTLSEQYLEKLSFTAATITLVSVKPVWQQEVAEFLIQANIKKGSCEGRAWFAIEDGRPLQHYWDCYGFETATGKEIQQNAILTRAWQYSDKAISQISPTPLPQLHPNGPITGLAYSEALNRLLILSRSKEGDEHWLTYWDSNRRQAILSRRAIGDKLALSHNNKLAAIASPQGFITGDLQINDRYKRFGQIKPVKFELDNKVLAMGLHGLYPITLNNSGDIEIWNLGYGKRVANHQLEDKSQSLLSVAADGRILTSNGLGQAYLFTLKLDTSACKDNQTELSWCEETLLEEFTQRDQFTIPATNITAVSLHPQEPLIALTLDSYRVALFNYKTESYTLLEGSTIEFDSNNDTLITDVALYDLSGSMTMRWEFNTPLAFDSERQISSAGKSQVFYQGSGEFDTYSGLNQVHMRDKSSGQILATIEAQTSPSVSLSHQGHTLFTTSNDKVMAFDLAKLQTLKQEAVIPQLKRMAISGKTLALHTQDTLISFSAAADGTTSTPVIINARINDFAFNDEDIFYAEGKKLIRLHDSGESKETIYTAPAEIRRLSILDIKGEKFALLLSNGKVWLPHLNKTLDPGTSSTTQIIANKANGHFYLSALSDHSGFWNSAIPLIRKFDGNGIILLDLDARWDDLTAFQLDHRNRLWAGNAVGNIHVWDTRTGRHLYQMNGHQDRINDLHQLDDGTISSAANDGTIRLWHTDIPDFSFNHQAFIGASMLELFDNDIKKRKPEVLATIILDKQGGYVVAGGDGYYTASPGALNRTSFTEGDKILDYSSFDLWLNRPDILARRISHSGEDQIKLLEQMVIFRRARHPNLPLTLPSLENAPLLTVSLPEAATASANLELPWQALAHGDAQLVRLAIDVNGVPLYAKEGLKVEEKETSGNVSVPLSYGQNNIRISVSDSNGLISSPTHVVVNRTGMPSKPALYLLAIGVSDYGNDALDLNYADKDARDVASYYQQHGESFSEVHVKTILNTMATRSNIVHAKQFLQQARTDDRVIIFFAGHGFLDDEERYYFGTTDIEPADPQLNGLSYTELNNLVDGLSSRYKLLLLDTCHSGEVAPLKGIGHTSLSGMVAARGFNIKRRAKPPAFEFSLEALQGRFADLREATGTIVLSAAGGQEFALENSEWGNGVFTASVLKGLNGSVADNNNDGLVAVSELRTFVYKEVQRLTNGKQKPTTRELNLSLDFAVN